MGKAVGENLRFTAEKFRGCTIAIECAASAPKMMETLSVECESTHVLLLTQVAGHEVNPLRKALAASGSDDRRDLPEWFSVRRSQLPVPR